MSDPIADPETVAARSRAREADIIGKPPRIAPLKPEEFSDEVLQITRELKIAAGLPPEGEVPEFIAIALRHPKLYRPNIDFALVLMAGGALSARDRELAILRTGWLCQAPFEWGEHVNMSKRLQCLDSVEIDRVTIGSSAPEWTDEDRAVLRAVEEMFDDAMIGDETWAALAARMDDKALIELPMLVGQYMGVAFLQNSVRSPMMAGNGGLMAR
jgi:4-carboxymuconolactone decarboxylase